MMNKLVILIPSGTCGVMFAKFLKDIAAGIKNYLDTNQVHVLWPEACARPHANLKISCISPKRQVIVLLDQNRC